MNVNSALLVQMGIVAKILYKGVSCDTTIRFYPNPGPATVSKECPAGSLGHTNFEIDHLELKPIPVELLLGHQLYMAYSSRCNILAVHIPQELQVVQQPPE